MAVIAKEKSMSVITLGALVAFISQMSLLLHFSKEDYNDYSEKTLFGIVLLYDSILAIIFMLISEYYEGDTFMFSKKDAMLYYEESMQVAEANLFDGLGTIYQKYPFDDWGAFTFDSLIMYIIPSKFFLNIIYTSLTAFSSVYLYRLALMFLSSSYSFLASLAYSTSSYLIFYNCSFLKESVFVFIVISSLYHIYNYIINQSNSSLIYALVFLGLQFFFRPAVAALIIVSVFLYYAVINKGKAVSLFLYLIISIMLAATFTKLMETANAYTAGGDIDAVVSYRSNGSYSSSFNLFVSYFGAFLGPFPSLFSGETPPSRLVFYGAGLMFKTYIAIPFWIGIFFIIKKRILTLLPLCCFIILEMVLTGYILGSLELRKVLLHIPFVYIIAYWGLYNLNYYHRFRYISTITNFIFVIGVFLLWNIIKVK